MASVRCLSEISKRLEEGWVLLQQHCPIPSCGTPLLRDRKKEVYCAKCEMYCISAEKVHTFGPPSGKADARAAAGEEVPSTPRNSSSVGYPPADACEAVLRVSEEQPSAAKTAGGRRSRAAAEAIMGEKLLQGWAMLAEECPAAGCCFPLMRDANRNTLCVACNADGVGCDSDTAAAAAAAAAAATMKTAHEDTNGQFADPFREAARASAENPPPVEPSEHISRGTRKVESVVSEVEFAAVRKKRDALSASLGRYMLQGWSLLDRTCPREGCEPGTPLLKNRSSGTFLCAACNTRMSQGETGDLVDELVEAVDSTTTLPSKRDSSGDESTVFPLAAKEGAERPVHVKSETTMKAGSEYELAERARLRRQALREQNNGTTTSSTLSERLLQGWAMLSTTCPAPGCHSPLMRDRAGKEQCVSCSGSDASTACCTPRRTGGATADASPVQAAGDLMAELEMDGEEDQSLLDGGAGRMYAERRRVELLAGSRVAAVANENPGAKGADLVHSRVRSEAINTLYRALDISQKRLRACSSVEYVDVEESMRQADLIAKLAMTTRAVESMVSSS